MTSPSPTADQVLEPAAMGARREAYFAFVRRHAAELFRPDGTYQPTTESDGRIAYWILPAFLAAADAAEREFGLRVYAAGAGWQAFDIFMTSCVAVHLARHGAELAAASEEAAVDCQRRAAQAVVDVLQGRWSEHAVNPEVKPWFVS